MKPMKPTKQWFEAEVEPDLAMFMHRVVRMWGRSGYDTHKKILARLMKALDEQDAA